MSKVLGALGVCLLLAPLAHAQETITAQAVSTVTLRDLPDLSESSAHVREVNDKHRSAPWGALPMASGTRFDAAPSAAIITAPQVTTLFASTSSTAVAPGDAGGAVGANAIFTATNDKIAIHSRSGALLLTKFLYQFIQVDPIGDNLYYYDPRVAYDAAANRWIAVALENGSYLIVAVSQSGDPTGTWTKYKLQLNGAIGEIDFTRLALTRDHVMLATNDDVGTNVLSIAKSNLYALPFTLQVQRTTYESYGATPVASDGPERYVAYLSATILVVVPFADPNGNSTILPSPILWSAPFAAPQLGSGQELDTGYGELEMAVIRDGKFYAAHCGAQSSPARTSVIWWVADLQTEQRLGGGIIDDPTGATWYAYPSLAVNHKGSVVIGFSTFSRTSYPSAAFVHVNASGAISNVASIRSGDSTSTGTDRWGDYTTTVVDPLDDSAFWTIQLATDAHAWRAWWAKIPVAAAPSKSRSVRH
jgi:hypothetical protein